ncbi:MULTISPECIES: hypothetical protein [Microbacterium]|uniref:hypothetical protein n=1 Tax=Microbacterium TaxID=33882 RepID=UPI00278B1D41|nr:MULTISPECIES: hypothetical protein [Microbacterium]MDQ1074453.1 hypothetical protein [Microbacterium sp. SORGH_AS_0969]MDQ1114683.1 hypothetical protein [Microbacterium testaceum]
MNDRYPPSPMEPGEGPADSAGSPGSADLPDVFDGLVGIDVVDGELVPREPGPPRA